MTATTSSASAPAASGPITRLAAAWQARNPRERTLLIAAAVVIGVAIAVSFLDWTRSERTRLGRSLPRAEAQLEQVQESATEIGRLRAQPAPQRLTGPTLLEAVQATAKARALGVTIQSAGDGLQVKGQAGFDDLVGWLATLQQDHGLRVQRMEVQQQGATASVDLLLAPAAS